MKIALFTALVGLAVASPAKPRAEVLGKRQDADAAYKAYTIDQPVCSVAFLSYPISIDSFAD